MAERLLELVPNGTGDEKRSDRATTSPGEQNYTVEVIGSSSGDGADTSTFDWLGRPALNKKSNGRPASFFILGNVCLWYIAYFGIFFNMVLFFSKVLHRSNASAASNTTYWSGSVLLCSVIGAFVADSYLGHLWTCVVSQFVSLTGMALLTLSASRLASGDTSSGHVAFFYASLYIVALGFGSFLPTLQTLGGDQFDTSEEKSSFFSIYIVANTTGMAIATTLVVYIVNKHGWKLGFSVSSGAGALAIALFLLGLPTYRQHKPAGNPFLRIAQVLTAATIKWRASVPRDNNELHEVSEAMHALQRRCRILHTESLRYLDKAATVVDEGYDIEAKRPDSWMLCTVTQVEEVKCLCRILPIWASCILYNTIHAQASTSFVEQGAAMNRHVGGRFTIPAPSMNLFSLATIATFPLIYHRCIVPVLRNLRAGVGLKSRALPSPLQRIGTGYGVCLVAMTIAAVVETRRLSVARKEGLIKLHHEEATVSMSILCLIPQYVLLGMGHFFIISGQMEFFYGQVSPSMRSLGSSFCQTCIALGDYLNSVLLTIVSSLSTRGGSPGWIPKDLNEGHLNYFYTLLCILTAINLSLFVAYSSRFQPIRAHRAP